MGDCTHDLADMETAAADGQCPLCLARMLAARDAKIAQLEAVAEAARAYEAEQIPRNRERLFNTLAAL